MLSMAPKYINVETSYMSKNLNKDVCYYAIAVWGSNLTCINSDTFLYCPLA